MALSAFKPYIQAICKSACLARTVHANVLLGENSMGDNPLPLWVRLKHELGEKEAMAKVDGWLAHPYRL